MKEKIAPSIPNLKELLFHKKLSIPTYQRPYKWHSKNVNQLIDDIILFQKKSAYRLGTIVVYNNTEDNNTEDNSLEIVDGQQRIVTLSIIAYELLQTENGKRIIGESIEDLSIKSFDVSNPISLSNIKQNQQIIKSRIHEFNNEIITFFLDHCQMVYIQLNDISEAFQFFDSQNSRGKDLEPHDLLKAFHLRNMASNTESERYNAVEKWELVSEDLHNIFSKYLFTVRQWSKGKSGLYFTKTKVNVFKGISVEEENLFNYAKPYKISHFFTEKYNQNFNRKIDNHKINFPFQIDQVMLNGKRFFEFVHYYSAIIVQIENLLSPKQEKQKNSIITYLDIENKQTKEIILALRNYKGQYRDGDKYIRNVFNCSLLYYIDKFGNYRLDEALLKFFIWSYKLRMEKRAVQRVTVDNHAKYYKSVFRIIREAVHPNEILHLSNPTIEYVGDDKMVKNTVEITNIFKNRNLI